ncbi:WD repeat, SAM and U-box domain-containing protein 1 [Halotydeus destructor]|nr:WD repeat, SAM and U-box domain-containing protein 1 [Halotydeus destructor]
MVYIILWNAQTGQQVVKLRHVSECAVRVCAFSPSCAILASAGDDETICIWDISTRSLIRSLVGHEAMVTAVSFSPDSNYLISGSSGGDIKLWDARHGHGKCLDTVTEAHDLGVTSCDFSSQYQVKSIGGALKSFYILASCGNDDLVKIWHVQSGIRCSIVLSSVLEGHTGNINCCQFSQDGTLLASAAGDKSVIIWNPITAQMVHRLEGHNRYVTCCTFSADNCYLATGSNDKSLIVWSLDGRPNLVLKRKNSFLINFDTLNTNEGQLMSSGNAASGWSVDSVVSWITQLGLAQYEDVFRKHEIDGQELLHLTHDTLLTTMKVEALGHRNKLLRGVQGLRNPLWQHSSLNVDDDVSLPEELYCPITHEFMREPVVASDGYSYEKEAIKEWLTSGKMTSPMTNEPLADSKLIANKTLSLLIKKYLTP